LLSPAAEGMRLLSKVIKALSVKLDSPLVIDQKETADGSDGIEFVSSSDLEAGFPQAERLDIYRNSDTVSRQDVIKVKEQASEILRETEEMVKELIQTAGQEAEKIIASANEEARRIIAEGQNKLKQIEEAAHHLGWQAGYEESRKMAAEEHAAKLREARELIDKANAERQAIIAGSEDEIVRLAVAVARKIISHELTTSPAIIVEIVKKAIQKATDREELTVRVNPENLDSTINSRDEITRTAKGIRKLKIQADPAVASGGCVVESPNGTVDARVERQFKEIEQALMEVGPNA